jgi:hypothetical protein
MTFQEAVEELKVLAGNNDWAFQYQVASYLREANIVAYINRVGVGHAEPHNTYQGAIDNMKMKINNPAEIDDPAPKDEVA